MHFLFPLVKNRHLIYLAGVAISIGLFTLMTAFLMLYKKYKDTAEEESDPGIKLTVSLYAVIFLAFGIIMSLGAIFNILVFVTWIRIIKRNKRLRRERLEQVEFRCLARRISLIDFNELQQNPDEQVGDEEHHI